MPSAPVPDDVGDLTRSYNIVESYARNGAGHTSRMYHLGVPDICHCTVFIPQAGELSVYEQRMMAEAHERYIFT